VSRPRTWWLAWGTWLFTLVLYGLALTIIGVTGVSAATQQNHWAARIALLVAFVEFATVGALVASRQPRNAVGWMFLGIALLVALSVFGGEYANYVFVEGHDSLPLGRFAGWCYLWTWYPTLALIVTLPMVFPDGRPPGPRFRVALRAMIVVSVVIVGLWCVRPGPMSDPGDPPWPDNPIGIGALDPVFDVLEAVGALIVFAFFAISGASMVVRFRRSRGDERQQLKWMTYGVCVMAAALLAELVVAGDVADVLFALTIAVLPTATAVAMFKYRLYEIDRVISRTLVYGTLTMFLVGAYTALVLAGQAVFSSFAGGSNLAIAASTLVVAALALPLRSRVQRFVDRRFYRRRYDAQRTLEAFGARLREEIDLSALGDDLRGVVVETMQPAHVSVWLRSRS